MKKLLSLVIAMFMIFCFTGCEPKYDPAPLITEGEFPFVVEYEMDGERYLIEDTVVCYWNGYDMTGGFEIFGFPYTRSWRASLKSGEEHKRLFIEFEPNTKSLLVKGRVNTESRVILYYGHGGYYLGDPDYDKAKPKINYIEHYTIIPNRLSPIDSTALSNEQLEKYFGIKIIRFEFAEPIENKFE